MSTGGSFLIEESTKPFCPEDFTDEHRAIARSANEFWKGEVEPHLDAIRKGDHDAAVAVLRKSAELGLVAITTPEQYGGMELDLVSALIVAETVARDGSYAAWHGAHAGIGTLPLLLFGTAAQKQNYLPKLSTGELIGAYCLSEANAGSDALAARTKAVLNPEGTHYILNGQKNWITNGGKAGLFTVFAKVDGEKFTAFLVERTFPGVSTGAEEHKMGIKGSSTCAVFLDNVPVPVENVLGEIGRGHIIAFNILNLGRLKLGPFAVGGAKDVLAVSLKYAKERQAFGHSISDFGMIQHKLAEMAIRIYAAESISYRVAGLIESSGKPLLASCEEFAAECSIVKVYASEMLDYVVDEGVQIHGGYGFHADYAVERAYRDSRINRIFEGTNEINRLLIAGMLLKRAQRGQLPLVKAAKSVMDEIVSGSTPTSLVASAKKIALLLLGLAYQKFLDQIEKQQELIAAIADVITEIFAMESVELRAKSEIATQYRDVYLRDAMARIEISARTAIAACSEGDTLRTNMTILRRFAKYEPLDAIAIRRRIAHRLLDAGRYLA
jgi:alkylation response protein AidB-like acyl-CoA dehydrogenase